jgi:hypothetical protein
MYMMVRKRISKPGSSASISKHSVETPSEEALKYWTADKMRKAKPADMPKVTNPGRRKKQPQRPPNTPEQPHS